MCRPSTMSARTAPSAAVVVGAAAPAEVAAVGALAVGAVARVAAVAVPVAAVADQAGWDAQQFVTKPGSVRANVLIDPGEGLE